MDLATVLVKIAGVVFLSWTAYSVVKHVKTVKAQRAQSEEHRQSVSETILNNFILYLWLAFMTVFSIGMIVNN